MSDLSGKPIICPQCGGIIPSGAPRCPYCGSAYAPEAEREYMQKLHKVRGELDKVGNVGAEVSGKEIGKVGKKIAVVLGIIFVLAAIISAAGVISRSRENARNRREYEWKQKAIPEMNELYERGDYDALLEKFHEAQYGEHIFYEWEHYTFCELYSDAKYADELLEGRENGYFLRDDAVELLYKELEFRGITARTGIPSEDKKLLREILKPYENDLKEIFLMSEEEMKDFDRELQKYSGYPIFASCEKYVDAHQEILRGDNR